MLQNDPFFWYKRTEIVIPRVRGEHLLMHITDTHLNARDELSTPEEREKFDAQEALWAAFKGKFAEANHEPCGEAQQISTKEAFDKQLALARELRPEALLLAGDNLDYMHGAGARYLARSLAAYPGNFLCVPGNHEADACEGAWRAGVQVLELEGFRVVAVNDRELTVSDEDLEALRALCAEKVPILLLCHVPIMTPLCRAACTEELFGRLDYFYIDPEKADANARAFVALCETEDAIHAVLCGHVHGFHAMELAPGKPQLVGAPGMIGAVHLVTVRGD